MKEDSKSAIGLFCCGIILGVCITMAVSNLVNRPCNHQNSKYDVTFARTSVGTLLWNVNSPELTTHKTFYPESKDYAKVCEYFEPYMAYATSLSHNRGRQVTFCEKCWPLQEDLK